MTNREKETLEQEINQFQKEQQKIRDLIGAIGGSKDNKKDRTINYVFISLLIFLFSIDILRHLFNILVFLPPLFSLEIGVFLVSMKIIWMIHKQTKVEHFQFWILNSIEYRINIISKQLKDIEEKLNK